MIELSHLERGGGTWRLVRSELPAPEELAREQVLVALEAAAVAEPELARATGHRGAVAGIAGVGTVVRAGSGAEHLTGARVALSPVIPCGECARCRRGNPAVCPSRGAVGAGESEALASHVVARARWLCVLEPPIEVGGAPAALLGREAALAYSLYARAGIAPGERAVVLGRGAVARFAVEILAAKGVLPAAVATDGDWAEIAGAAGAQVVRADPEPDPDAILEALRERAPEEVGADAAGVIVETSGTAELRGLALALARPGGTAVLAGDRSRSAPSAEPPGALGTAASEGITLLGVPGPHPDLIPELAAMAARGDIDLAAAAAVAELDEIPAIAGKLARGALPGRAGVALFGGNDRL